MTPTPWLARRLAVLGGGIAVAALTLLDLCDWIYRCGCVAWWAGAAEHCNIQVPGPPDCPWCAAGLSGTVLPFGVIALGQAAAALPPHRLGLVARGLLVLAAIPALGGLAGLGFGLALGYW